MFTDAPITSMDGHCVKSDTGMDLTNAITLILEDGIPIRRCFISCSSWTSSGPSGGYTIRWTKRLCVNS